MASPKRIQKELADCSANPPQGMSIVLPSDADLHTWHVTLDGPSDSAYAGGKFGVIISLPTDYPWKPPVVSFSTRIYHPNISNDSLGNICLSILKSENWKPTTRVLSILEAVRQLLVEPQPDDPLESRIAEEYTRDRKEYEKNARQYVARYAKDTPTFEKQPAGKERGGN